MIRPAPSPLGRFLTFAAAAAVAALAGAIPARAASGRVVDERGQPLAGASACLMAEGSEIHCVTTDSLGRFALTPTSHPSIRVRLGGYMPVTVANVDQESPIVLPLAATIHVRVVDAASGKSPGKKGTLALVFPDGRRKDGFPITEAGDIVIRPIQAGAVRVRIQLQGFDDGGGAAAELEAGKTTDLVVKVREVQPGPR